MSKLRINLPPLPNREKYPFVASIQYRGMTIDVENLDGSVRTGISPNGKPWRTKFKGCHYGELRGSRGVDGDALDVYIKSKPDKNANKVYIVHQNHPRNHPTKAGKYDEDKVILGVSSPEAAKELYLRHYNRKDFFRSITEMPIEKFKRIAFGENKGEKVAASKKLGPPFIRTKMREGTMNKKIIEERKKWKSMSPSEKFRHTLTHGGGLIDTRLTPKQRAESVKRREAHYTPERTEKVRKAFKQRQRRYPMEGILTNTQNTKKAAEECKTPGMKIRSKGKGRGLARGRGYGPLGIPIEEKKKNMSKKSEVSEAYKAGVVAAINDHLGKNSQKIAQNMFYPGGGYAPLMTRGAPVQMQAQPVAGPQSTNTWGGISNPTTMTIQPPTAPPEPQRAWTTQQALNPPAYTSKNY